MITHPINNNCTNIKSTSNSSSSLTLFHWCRVPTAQQRFTITQNDVVVPCHPIKRKPESVLTLVWSRSNMAEVIVNVIEQRSMIIGTIEQSLYIHDCIRCHETISTMMMNAKQNQYQYDHEWWNESNESIYQMNEMNEWWF